MKKRINYLFLTLLLLILPISKIQAIEKVSCGNDVVFPKQMPSVISFVISTMLYLIPIILIVMGMIDLIKALIQQKEEDMKRYQKQFFKRILIAACALLIIVIVKTILNVLVGLNERNNVGDCLNCFINNECKTYVESDNQPQELNKKYPKVVAKPMKENSAKNNSTKKNSTKKNSTKNNPNYFIGDSRTEGMCKEFKLCQNDKYLGVSSKGFSWFKNTAVPSVSNNIGSTKHNIIILMGVNDLGTSKKSGEQVANKYYNIVYNLATGQWKNQEIIFASINPVINGMSNASTESVTEFNAQMKKNIENSNLSNLSYCNTYSSITINKTNIPDGLHYNKATYQKIYDTIKNSCL